jgi:hypothetical protein
MPSESDLASSRDSLLPWRMAESLKDSLVLWAPCRFGEMPGGQRAWLNLFLERWFALLASEEGLGEECFMQLETLQKEKKLSDEFYANLMRDRPLMGRSISSREAPPKGGATMEEIDLLIKHKVKYDYHAMSASRACWFRGSDTSGLRATYLGFGGMTILLTPRSEKNFEENQEREKQLGQLISRLKLPAFLRKDAHLVALVEGLDPQNPLKPPPFIRNHPAMAHFHATVGPQKEDAQEMMQRVMFGRKTKEIFGDSLKAEHSYAGIPFVLPRFSSTEILNSTVKERASWFELFDVYVRESPEDNGMLLAAKPQLLSGIVQVVKSLRQDGYRYWEG